MKSQEIAAKENKDHARRVSGKARESLKRLETLVKLPASKSPEPRTNSLSAGIDTTRRAWVLLEIAKSQIELAEKLSSEVPVGAAPRASSLELGVARAAGETVAELKNLLLATGAYDAKFIKKKSRRT